MRLCNMHILHKNDVPTLVWMVICGLMGRMASIYEKRNKRINKKKNKKDY